VATSSGKGGKH